MGLKGFTCRVPVATACPRTAVFPVANIGMHDVMMHVRCKAAPRGCVQQCTGGLHQQLRDL